MADGSLPPLPPGATLRRPLPPLPPGATLRRPITDLGEVTERGVPATYPTVPASPTGTLTGTALPPLPPGATLRAPALPADFDTEVARGPTTVPGEGTGSEPPEPSLLSQLLTQGWHGLASGVTTQGVTNLFGAAELEKPLPIQSPANYREQIQAYATMSPEAKLSFKQQLSRDHSPTAMNVISMLSDIDDGNLRGPEEIDAALGPDAVAKPMRERFLFQRAKELEAWQERNFPVPQDQGTGLDIYRSLLEGLGTVAASVGTAAGTPLTAAASAILGGRGEMIQEIYSDPNIAAAEAFQRGDQGVQPGLSSPPMADLLAGRGADMMAGLGSPGTEEEMRRRVDQVLDERLQSGIAWGDVAGGTDLLPLETLLNGIPGFKNANVVSRILGQAFVEFGQEGVQQLLQNTGIGKEITDGLAESALVGGGVGAITQTISELLQVATKGRRRGGAALTPEQQAALDARLQPSTGGRLDVEQPTLPVDLPEQLPPGGARPLAPLPPDEPGPLPLAPGEEQFELPLTQPGTPPTVQPVPGPGPPEGVPVTNQDIMTAHAMWKAAQDAYPPGDPRVTTALNDFMTLAARFSTEQEAKRAAAAPAGTQVLPTNAQPPAPPGPPGEAAVPAPEGSLPATPVAEPPIPPALPGPTGEEAAPAPAREEPTAPLPPAPPVAGPPPVAKTPEPVLARTEPEPTPAKPVTTKDVLGPVPPPQPDLKSFVIGQGGVQPTPNLSKQDANLQPGLIDARGETMDNMRQRMVDAGYIDEDQDANAAEQMIIDAMQTDAPKIYPKRALDQADAAAVDARKVKQSQLDEMAAPVEDAIVASGAKNVTAQERDQMIAAAFSSGDADEAVDSILRLRPEPAATVATADEPIPFDTGELPSAPGADGQPQLFMPGTERAEVEGQQVNDGKALRKALDADNAVKDQFNRRYTLRPVLGTNKTALWVDGKEVSQHLTRKSALDAAVFHNANLQKRIAPKKPQKRGVTDLSLFSDEGKQTEMPTAAAEPEPKAVGAATPGPAKSTADFIADIEGELAAGRHDADLAPTTSMDEFRQAAEARGWTQAPYGKGTALWSPDRKHVMLTSTSVEGNAVQVQYQAPGKGVKAPPLASDEAPFERLAEEAQGPVAEEESTTGLWGDDPEADQQQEADDAAEVELNTLTERTPRAGVTPTFGDVSMSTTTPGNADAAYTDAGLDPDQAKNMTAEGRFQALAALFKSKFGFKSVSRVGTYGQAKGQDAVDMMLDGYRAIRAMMHVLGMPETSGSLGGTLSLTLGRITKRSFMLGAYNPGDRSIELVGRSNGFAHEWAHALDHWLMDNVFGPITGNAEKMASRFARNTGLDPGIAIEDHFIRLMNNLFFDDAALAARVLDLQTKAGAVYGPKDAKAGQPTKDALIAQKLLDDVKAGRSKLIKEKSTYYKTARQYGKGNPYWTNPAEMLARAFEAYVAFKIVILDPDFANNFMTKGEAAYSNDADDRLAKTFPKSADRIRIYASFDTLMGIVNTQTALGGTVSAMPTANELLDDDMFYVHAARDARNAREKARQRSIVARWKNQLALTTSLSGWNTILDQVRDNLGARFGAPKDLISWGQRGSMFFKAWLFTEAAVANTIIERPQNAKAKVFLRAIGSQLFELAPGRGDLARETWGEAVSAYVRTYAAKLENILDAHGIDLQVPLDAKSPAARDAVGVRNRLESILTTGVEMPGTSASERRAAAQIRTQIFDEIWRDAGRAGLDIGYVEDAPYLPIIPEPHAIHANREGFITAATTLYELVFDRSIGTVAGNMRNVDNDVLQNAIQDIKNWNTPWTLNDPDIVRLRAKADRQRAQLKDLRQKQSAALRPDLLQAQIDALADDLQITLDELAIEIKPLWAATKAEQWHDAFIHGEYSAMDTLGPQTRHTKERVLPSESQQIMAEFIVTDPVDAAMIYINAMARKIEYSSRFGKIGGRKDFENLITRPKSPILAEMKARGLDPARPEDRVTAIQTLTDPMIDDRLKMLMTEAQRAGAITEDLTTLREQVEFMTGRKSEGSALMRGLSNLVYAGGSVALMPRAWWTSLMEALTVLARTGDIKTTGKVLGHQLNEATGWALPQRMKDFLGYKGTTVADINDLARTIGLISSEGQDVMLQVTLGDIPMSSRLSKFMAEFYERIGLAALTRMQKRAVLAGYNMWLNKLLRMAKGEPNAPAGDKAVARANLADLGIAEAEIKPLDDWLHARGQARQMNAADAKTPMGRFWAEGARRFVHSVVQEGTKATSPRMMAHPMGRLVFGLMRFAYTFTRNILIRPIRQALRDEKLRLDAGEGRQAAAARAFRDNLLYRGIIGMGALWLGQSLAALLRELIFNGEQYERHIEEGDLIPWIMKIGASRSGVYGPFDAVLQAVTGLRYQRDITSMTSGPFMNMILSSAQALGEAYYNNSPNTNTSERNVVMAGLRTIQTPLIMAGLTILPGGRYLNALWAGTGMLASSNSLLSWETSLIAGPRRDTGPKGSGGRLDFSSRPKF